MKRNETPTLIITATGACKEVTGSADVIIHFEGLNGVTMAYPMNILVHPDLTQDLLLGRDFTGSKAKSFETNNRMYLTQSPDKLLGDVLEMIRQKNLCEVPLMSSNSKAKFFSTNEMMIIPPFSTVAATCSLQKSPTQEYHLPFNTAGLTTYEVLNATYPKIETAKMLYFYEDPKQIYITLFNDTHEEITFAAGTTVAEIELWADNNEHEVHHVKIVGKGFDHFECNNAQMDNIPDFITDDEGMNEEEQQEAFMKYIRYGYHHPSMTKQVEEKAALTEMTLQPTDPIPDKDLAKQFDVAHLPIQAHLRKVVKENKEAFSKHPFDLGKAKGIKMKIPITTDQPHIQKYIPIPHSIRPQVRDILDQYVERGIIRECNEPSAFCSNILVVKKKDGKSI